MNNTPVKVNQGCCKTKLMDENDLKGNHMVAFSNKIKSYHSTQNSLDSAKTSTDSIRLSLSLKGKENIRRQSEKFENKIVDHSIEGLMRYQKEIDKGCSEDCPTKRNFTVDLIQLYGHLHTSNFVDFSSIVFMKTIYPQAPSPYVIDAECYTMFHEFFNNLIYDLHNKMYIPESYIPRLKFDEIDKFKTLDLNGEQDVSRVLYCEIVIRRNIEDFNLTGCLRDEQRMILKKMLKVKCRDLFTGLNQTGIPFAWIERLKHDEPFLLESRGMNRYPRGRLNLVYLDSQNCHIGAIINFDDHLQIVLSTNNGKLGHIYNESNKYMNSPIMQEMKFQKHDQFGYVTYSPQFVGTGFVIRITLQLIFVCLLDDVEDIYLKDLSLSFKPFDKPEKGLVILSNRKTIATCEIEIFHNILLGFRRLSELETELEMTSPSSIVYKTMPVESINRLSGKINMPEHAPTYTKKYLTGAIIRQYNSIPTIYNGLLNHCVRANAFYPNSLFPKACDPDCYSAFCGFFNPIILEANHCRQFLHNFKPEYGTTHHEKIYKFDHKLIRGYRVRFSRNLDNYPFSMLMSSADRNEIESKMISAFKTFPKPISGTYYKLEDIYNSDIYYFLESLNLLPKANNLIKRASWVYHEWPKNRGVFLATKNLNHPQSVLTILVNEIDHFQVSCINFYGTRLDYCYDRAVLAMRYLDRYFNNAYQTKPYYGFLSSNPQNVGCCMRVGAKIYLKHLGSNRDALNDFCIASNLTYRGIHGSGSKSKDNIFDISLKLNLNHLEIQILMFFVHRIKDLIREERTYDTTIDKPADYKEMVETFTPNDTKANGTVKDLPGGSGD